LAPDVLWATMSRETNDRAAHLDHVLEELRLHTEDLTKWATYAVGRAERTVTVSRRAVADARTTVRRTPVGKKR
jgi:hypothetical protein